MQASKVTPDAGSAHASVSSSSSSALHRSWRRDLAICFLLGLTFFLIFNANMRSIGAVDTYPARYLPLLIWKHHNLTLDRIAPLVAQGREVPTEVGKTATAFWMRKSPSGSVVSFYPIVTPMVVAPLYLPAVAYLNDKGWDPQRVDHVARIMEKLSASLMAALSAMLLYLLLRRRSPPATAVLLTTLYALGTTTWVVSSQALWMHGLGQLLVVALLYVLTGRCTPLRTLGAGLLCALLAFNRQPDAIIAVGFALYAIRWSGPRFPLFLVAAVVPAGLILAYNLFVVGHFLGGYGLLPSLDRRVSQVGDGTLFGIGVLLFSPVYGLFVFSPFLLFVPLFLVSVLRDRHYPGLTVLAGGAVVLQLLFYAATHWEQGVSWGPRYLTSLIPILVWMLPPVVERLRTAGRAMFGLACIGAVVIQGLGAFYYTGRDFGAAMNAQGPSPSHAAWRKLVWDFDNTPFVSELKHGLAAPDFGELRGRVDVAGVRDEADPLRLVVAGWALMDSRTPSDVALMVDGKLVVGGTGTFFERPDVVHTLGEQAPSGWRVSFPADVLTPGDHVVAALVRGSDGGQQRMLEAREFTVVDDSPAVVELRGGIDVVNVHDEDDGQRVAIAGWALTNNLTPSDVTVMVDGQAMARSENLFERPDVVRELGQAAPSGWQVEFSAAGLTPGEHEVSVLLRAAPGGPQYLLKKHALTIKKPDPLARAAQRAAQSLLERQEPQGYWLSEFSKSTRFVLQGQELNIFTNAALIDLVTPVAQQSGLVDSLVRARAFLTNQIEDDGLVRYHGRPDLPTMGVMGCVITPDSDDTALAWKIAPSERSELLPQALSTLKQFRTPDGLYQTWLAPKDRFACIDPGENPNPPDIGIQLHVYLLLAQADPPAARELCTSLQRRSSDESLWVYYRMAPPIVLLRLNAVSKAGCPLQLPASRLQSTVTGQDVWLELIDHLRHIETAGALTAARSASIDLLLSKLAADNFASLKGNPPLLYHNDLTATVSRIYWSESFGYALWLRLYYENERARPSASHDAEGAGGNSEGVRAR